MTIDELIAKLEAATEGSRELDCDIFVATAPSPFVSYYPDCVLASLGGFAARVEIKDIPAYTTSLDAALTLVPERDKSGAYWRCIIERKPLHSGQAWLAEVRPHAKDGGYAIAYTPALALCVAAMKARTA